MRLVAVLVKVPRVTVTITSASSFLKRSVQGT
jgi:hypothetical protein